MPCSRTSSRLWKSCWTAPDLLQKPIDMMAGGAVPMVLLAFGLSLAGRAPLQKADGRTETLVATFLKIAGMARAGLIVAGYEINHMHVHVWPSNSMADFDFGSADQHPDPARLDANAEKLREGLRTAGHAEHVPAA